jgi:hypothetical protein
MISSSFQEIRKASVPLIKSFQSELDSLTTRSKAAESVVLELCRRISHIPGKFENFPSSVLVFVSNRTEIMPCV